MQTGKVAPDEWKSNHKCPHTDTDCLRVSKVS